jgi:hypothetical protein
MTISEEPNRNCPNWNFVKLVRQYHRYLLCYIGYTTITLHAMGSIVYTKTHCP